MRREPRELLEANLRAIAELRGLALEQVAERARLTLAELHAIFSGELDPDLLMIEALAMAVDSRMSALFFDPETDLRLH